MIRGVRDRYLGVDESWKELYTWYRQNEGQKVDRILDAGFFKKKPDALTGEEASRIIRGEKCSSVLQGWSGSRPVPYAHFLTYGLHLSDRERYEFEAMDLGNIAHQSLERFSRKADREKIGTPSIVLVGEVCRLSKKLHWAGDRILGGRQFLITRPAQQSAALAGRLRELGAQAIEMPSIRTEPVESDKDLDTALERLGTRTPEEWLVFTSPAGVEMFFEQMKKAEAGSAGSVWKKTRIRIGAIGPGTGKALEQRGIFPDVIPDVYNAKALGEAIARQAAGESYVTVARAKVRPPELIPLL